MKERENRVNQSEFENTRAEIQLLMKRRKASLGICHRNQMEPPKVGASSAATRKEARKLEKTPRKESFQINYLPLRMDDVPPI
jgi:hypothetical protein